MKIENKIEDTNPTEVAKVKVEAGLEFDDTCSLLSDFELRFNSDTESSENVDNYNQRVDLSDKDDDVGDNHRSSSSQPVYMPFDSVRVRQLTFRTIDEAEDFYIAYGREAGFDVCKTTLHRSDDGLIKNRLWVCHWEGFRRKSKEDHCRKREAKHETRCGCRASFRVAHDRNLGLYKVTRFVQEHNHPLKTKEIPHHLRCNR